MKNLRLAVAPLIIGLALVLQACDTAADSNAASSESKTASVNAQVKTSPSADVPLPKFQKCEIYGPKDDMRIDLRDPKDPTGAAYWTEAAKSTALMIDASTRQDTVAPEVLARERAIVDRIPKGWSDVRVRLDAAIDDQVNLNGSRTAMQLPDIMDEDKDINQCFFSAYQDAYLHASAISDSLAASLIKPSRALSNASAEIAQESAPDYALRKECKERFDAALPAREAAAARGEKRQFTVQDYNNSLEFLRQFGRCSAIEGLAANQVGGDTSALHSNVWAAARIRVATTLYAMNSHDPVARQAGCLAVAEVMQKLLSAQTEEIDDETIRTGTPAFENRLAETRDRNCSK